jgi:hypothetical protein
MTTSEWNFAKGNSVSREGLHGPLPDALTRPQRARADLPHPPLAPLHVRARRHRGGRLPAQEQSPVGSVRWEGVGVGWGGGDQGSLGPVAGEVAALGRDLRVAHRRRAGRGRDPRALLQPKGPFGP